MSPHRDITITDLTHGLPFSKGLLAQSIMATGLAPRRAYEIAASIRESLLDAEQYEITVEGLMELVRRHLEREEGPALARRYVALRELARMERPLIILIGGTTGVGKSTVATEVAHRLGITRIASTDSIRQVMRGIFSTDLMPALHESAYDAWRGLRIPVPEGANPVIVGFREQTAAVSAGIKSLIERAVTEGYSMVVEGIHLVPGYIDPCQFESASVVQLVIGVDDERLHMSHFFSRDVQTQGSRPLERYRAGFPLIRSLGEYIEALAVANGIPVVDSGQLDRTVADVLEYVVAKAIAPTGNEPESVSGINDERTDA